MYLRLLLLGGDDGFQFLLSALLAVGTVGSAGCGLGDLLCLLDCSLLDVGSIHFRGLNRESGLLLALTDNHKPAVQRIKSRAATAVCARICVASVVVECAFG